MLSQMTLKTILFERNRNRRSRNNRQFQARKLPCRIEILIDAFIAQPKVQSLFKATPLAPINMDQIIIDTPFIPRIVGHPWKQPTRVPSYRNAFNNSLHPERYVTPSGPPNDNQSQSGLSYHSENRSQHSFDQEPELDPRFIEVDSYYPIIKPPRDATNHDAYDWADFNFCPPEEDEYKDSGRIFSYFCGSLYQSRQKEKEKEDDWVTCLVNPNDTPSTTKKTLNTIQEDDTKVSTVQHINPKTPKTLTRKQREAFRNKKANVGYVNATKHTQSIFTPYNRSVPKLIQQKMNYYHNSSNSKSIRNAFTNKQYSTDIETPAKQDAHNINDQWQYTQKQKLKQQRMQQNDYLRHKKRKKAKQKYKSNDNDDNATQDSDPFYSSSSDTNINNSIMRNTSDRSKNKRNRRPNISPQYYKPAEGTSPQQSDTYTEPRSYGPALFKDPKDYKIPDYTIYQRREAEAHNNNYIFDGHLLMRHIQKYPDNEQMAFYMLPMMLYIEPGKESLLQEAIIYESTTENEELLEHLRKNRKITTVINPCWWKDLSLAVLPEVNEWNERFVRLQTAWTQKQTRDAISRGDTIPLIENNRVTSSPVRQGYMSTQTQRMNTCKDKEYDTSI